MKYISTRGKSPSVDFEGALLNGLAPDGGLYVPESFPSFTKEKIASLSGLPYTELAYEVIQPFVGEAIPAPELKEMIDATYASGAFHHPSVAPLIQTDQNEWVMELFRGPTLAFKDFALQLLGRLLDYSLGRRGEEGVIMGATSGDTGSAAIEGCRHSEHLKIFILHPHNRVSDVQRLQMTTVLDESVHNLAVSGNFDDCQAMVKASFADQSFLKPGVRLIAINSINWARIMAQVVYYFHAALSLGAARRPISFSVPTGNFGDIYAGYVAKQMGLPVERLIVATNRNDILSRFINDNDYSKDSLHKTLSPSMDIMVSSNFERLLFNLHDNDGGAIDQLMSEFADGTGIRVESSVINACRQDFAAVSVTDEETCQTIREVYGESEYMLDPHSAIGLRAARECREGRQVPVVTLATAHPAKFEDAIDRSEIGVKPTLPNHLDGLFERGERYEVIANDLVTVQQFIHKNH